MAQDTGHLPAADLSPASVPVSAPPAAVFGGAGLQRPQTDAPGLPLVSVITVALNAKPSIEACLESVAAQDYRNIEHIVIDGGSTDGTIEILRKHQDSLAFWKSERDRGIYDAWNKGLQVARGDWICFLGADDEFVEGAVSAYMEFATANPEAEYLSSQVLWMHPNGYCRVLGLPWAWPRFARYMCTAHVGSMHRRRLFDRLGTYDISYRIVADYELLLRAKQTLKSGFMPRVTARMKAGGVSDSMRSLDEEMRAKIETGGRSVFLARFELQFARLSFLLRPLRRAVARMRAVR